MRTGMRMLYIAALSVFTLPCTAQTIYVDASATGADDGSGWTNAYTGLDTALNAAAAGDEIWVANGAYGPTLPATTLTIPTDVAVYGGFSGNETNRNQRDPDLYPTLIDGEHATGWPLVTITGGSHATIIDGFEISDATAGDDAFAGVGGSGAGMTITGGSPTITDCEFIGNTARLGGAALIIDSSPTFTDCLFKFNISARSGEGAAVYAFVSTGMPMQTVTFVDTVFEGNSAHQGHFATGNGGALYVGPGLDLNIQRCMFENNFSFHNSTYGNGVAGGGVYFAGNHMAVENSVFVGNYAGLGAGVYAKSGSTLECSNTIFSANRAVANGCVGFECNNDPDIPSGGGGGLYCDTATMNNCVFAHNWAFKTGGGAIFTGNGTIVNSILWHNTHAPVEPGEDVPPIIRGQIAGNYDFFSCNAEGLLEIIPGEDPPNPPAGSFDVDPMFAAAPAAGIDGDYHLLPGSPSIDAGDNSLIPAILTLDFDGNPRFADDPSTPDTGFGNSPIVDMGVYEITPNQPCPADTNHDGSLTPADFTAWIAAYNAGAPECDQNGDGNCTPADFTSWIANFNTGCL